MVWWNLHAKLFSRWKQSGHVVDIVHLDNAEENVLLQNQANSATWQLGIDFDFMVHDTPQQNSLAEVGIFTLANRVQAMCPWSSITCYFATIMQQLQLMMGL